MKIRKLTAMILAALLCLSLAASCAGEESEPKSIVLTENWDFESGFYPVITPSNATHYGIIYWTHNFYDTLVRYTPEGELVGSLAENWDISDDGLVYTFKIREGVQFSEGTVLTAPMVKQSIQASITNLGMYNGTYGKLSALIASMDAPDDSTFVMTLSTPYYATLNDLSMCCPLGIVNPVAFEGGDENAYTVLKNATNGTGPYMYAGDYDGNTYTFVRNPYYWGEAPEADTFSIKVIPENDAKVLALRSGEIDGIIGSSRLDYDSFDSLRGEAAYGTLVAEAATMTRMLGFNMSAAPFDDAAVRMAVAYAIDQQALETAVFNGIETAAEKVLPETRPYCNVETTTYETDVEKAKELLEGTGWIDIDGDGIREKDGAKLEIVLSYTNDLTAVEYAVLAVKSQLDEVGFSVTLKGGDMMTWYGDVMAGAYNITLWKTSGGAYDPSTAITNINPNSSADPVFAQYAPFIGQELMDELDSTADLGRVEEIYKVILTTIADECLNVPLSYPHATFAFNAEKVDGYIFGYDNSYVDVANIDLK